MRMRPIFVVASIVLSSAARADDTRPPQISDVRAAVKSDKVTVEARITDETGVLAATCHHRTAGGRAEDTPMVKDEFSDLFRATFAGGSGSGFWIDATDLLGNGPATYGSSAKPIAVGEAAAPGEPQPQQQKKPLRPAPTRPAKEVAKSSPPAGTQPRQGEELAKKQPAVAAPRGDVEASVPDMTTAKPPEPAPGLPPAAEKSLPPDGGLAVSAPYVFTGLPPHRVPPGRPIALRAQVVPAGDGQLPARVAVLWRGSDSKDQLTEMSPDETGGWGGYKAQLPAQEEGALFFQIFACDAEGSRCAVDTGSKRKWHATIVAPNPGAPRPTPLDAVSSKAPAGLPQ